MIANLQLLQIVPFINAGNTQDLSSIELEPLIPRVILSIKPNRILRLDDKETLWRIMNVENACIYRSVVAVAVPLVTINLKRIMRQVVLKRKALLKSKFCIL